MEITNKKQKNLFLACGIPGAGKSTWLTAQNDFEIVSRDTIRFTLLRDDDDYFSKEDEVIFRFFHFIRDAINELRKPANVCADATHLTPKARSKTLRAIGKEGVSKIIALSFETPLNVALERNAQRTGRSRVPDTVIKNMHYSWVVPKLNEGFDEIWHIDAEGNVRKEIKNG